VTQKHKKRGHGGQSIMSESGDSSDTGLGIMIEEIHAEDTTVDKDQRSLPCSRLPPRSSLRSGPPRRTQIKETVPQSS
jgi:ubiquitin